MITVTLAVYAAAIIIVLIVQDTVLEDWDFWPGYFFYTLLAPITVPVTLFVYFIYKFYTKFIRSRIIK